MADWSAAYIRLALFLSSPPLCLLLSDPAWFLPFPAFGPSPAFGRSPKDPAHNALRISLEVLLNPTSILKLFPRRPNNYLVSLVSSQLQSSVWTSQKLHVVPSVVPWSVTREYYLCYFLLSPLPSSLPVWVSHLLFILSLVLAYYTDELWTMYSDKPHILTLSSTDSVGQLQWVRLTL